MCKSVAAIGANILTLVLAGAGMAAHPSDAAPVPGTPPPASRGDTALPFTVEAGPEQVTIRVPPAVTDATVEVAEFPIWNDALDLPHAAWRTETPLLPGAELVLPRFVQTSAGQRDRALSRWAAVIRDGASERVDGPCRYAGHAAIAAAPPRPLLRNKKGLGGYDIHRGHESDLDELGLSTVTVNVHLGFVHLAPGAGRVPVQYGESTFYVDQGALDGLDATLRAAARRDLLVFAIVLVPAPHPDAPATQRMAHPDYQAPAYFAMPDVTTPGGVELYGAMIDFLAQRYSRPDGRFGRIHDWIVHNEVDAGRVWTNAGDKTAAEFMQLYHRSLRIVHQLARLYDPHARAFISLTHSWTEPEQADFYSSRELLDLLNAASSREGDFEWGVAYHPYPQSLLVPETWRDERATHAADSPLVTFKNIEVLAEWARRPENRYQHEIVRDVYLTEQGFHSRDYSDEQLRIQAAALAYAWQQIKDVPEIKAMHYHNWIDNRHEGGLRIGLRRFPDDADDPAGVKPAWRLYRDLGGPEEMQACEFALPVVGIDEWSQLGPETRR